MLKSPGLTTWANAMNVEPLVDFILQKYPFWWLSAKFLSVVLKDFYLTIIGQ